MSSNNAGKGSYAAATASITLVLLLLGAVAYFLVNARRESKSFAGNVGFSIMLADGITSAQRTAIEENLESEPLVREFGYLSKEEAAREFREYIQTDFETLLDENPIPASYELTLQNEKDNDADVLALEKRAAQWEGVSMVLYQHKTAEKAIRILNRINLILLGFGALLLGVAIILIYNTLRLDVAANGETIRTMKLVGARNSFIRRPFLIRSLTQGALAGVLACAALYFLVDGVAALLSEDTAERDWQLLAAIFCSMIVAGIVICTLFTRMALTKYIKQ